MCFQYLATVKHAKLYTRKELFMMETYITDFNTSLYIPEIQKLVIHLPHVHIIETNHCGNTCQKSFKCCSANQDVLCHCYYADIMVDSFSH